MTTNNENSVPVYVPTADGEVIQQAYVVDSNIPLAPVVQPDITSDMVKTYSLARTVKFLTSILGF